MTNRHNDAEMRKIEDSNFSLFRDCLSTPLIEKSSSKPRDKRKRGKSQRGGRKNAIKPVIGVEEKVVDDASELAEFVDVSLITFTRIIVEVQELGLIRK
jgi:hypothetical protein